MSDSPNSVDRYEAILYDRYTHDEINEIQQLMEAWDKATYPTLPTSIVKHTQNMALRTTTFAISAKPLTLTKRVPTRNISPTVRYDGTRTTNF